MSIKYAKISKKNSTITMVLEILISKNNSSNGLRLFFSYLRNIFVVINLFLKLFWIDKRKNCAQMVLINWIIGLHGKVRCVVHSGTDEYTAFIDMGPLGTHQVPASLIVYHFLLHKVTYRVTESADFVHHFAILGLLQRANYVVL